MKDERRPICEVVAESIERLIIDGVLRSVSHFPRNVDCVKSSASHAPHCVKG